MERTTTIEKNLYNLEWSDKRYTNVMSWLALHVEVEKRVNENLEIDSEERLIDDFIKSQPIGVHVPVMLITKKPKKTKKHKNN